MIKEAISRVVAGQSLTEVEAGAVMEEIMRGEVTPAQFGAFVTALRCKGETVEEITGMVKTMRQMALPVTVKGLVVDTCGTGGDASGTFNISTVTAFVAAGAGLKIAKHGNRAMSSRCGSADVLEALGIKVELSPEKVAECISSVGIGFIFAPAFHPLMKHAAAPRREIGIRTVFNILGPLSNPAGVLAQVLGVADGNTAEKMALVLRNLDCRHALVVYGDDGLDEITLTTTTQISEVKNGAINKYALNPQAFGMRLTDLKSLKGGSSKENAEILRNILTGETGPRREVVLLNTAAALIAGDMATDFSEGIKMASKSIDSGQALQKLNQIIQFTQSCG